MKFTIRALLIIAAVAVAAVATTTLRAEAKRSRSLKFATLAPKGSTWSVGLHEWSDAVEKGTGGAVDIRFYEGGVAGDEKDVVRKMRIGQQHGGAFTGVGLSEFCKDIRVMDAPLLFRSYAEKDYVLKQLTPYFEKCFDEGGAVLAGWGEVGFIYIYSNEPVRAKSDLLKMKVWGWDADPLSLAYMSNAGVTPIPLPIPDVLTSLQTGLIDTVYASPLAMIALQWFTKVKYVAPEPFAIANGGNLITKKFWKKLTPEQQKVVQKTGFELGEKLVQQLRADNESSAATLKERGISTSESNLDGEKELRAISDKTREELAGKVYSKEVYEQVKKHLSDYRAMQAKAK
ncbi:MAG: TRAP transporter substrate-binding protein DctP [Myxococcales bacterium]|nr:TRAP transporter substrate-binding protein DctP [Myxococcales bacterium]